MHLRDSGVSGRQTGHSYIVQIGHCDHCVYYYCDMNCLAQQPVTLYCVCWYSV